MVDESENWDASTIHRKINSVKHPAYREVPLPDVESLVASNFLLYSWGGNGIRFRREDHQGLYLEVGDKGYRLQIQYASITEEVGCRYNLRVCEKFFKSRTIKIVNLGSSQIHTQDLPLEDTIRLYIEFETHREELKWTEK